MLVLPTVSGAPLPSPEMVSESVPSRDEAPTLSPWRVRGLSLGPLTALGWLVGQPSEVGSMPEAIRLGEDVRYWVVASRLALEILARQRFLPDLETSSRGTRASTKWKPLLEEENERLELLIASMPPVCRAFVEDPGASSDPEALLRSFFADIIDEFVRQAASRLRLRPRVVDSEGARFAAALLDPLGQLSESKNVLVYLKEELSDWKQFLEEEIEAPFRVSFRLEPPTDVAEAAEDAAETAEDGETSEWILRYFLQAVDDPSLLVPVARVWEHSGATWRYLNRRMDRPQERILEALGRASSFLPAIEESLKTPRPEFCRLSLNEAYHFLRETSFLLRESGFGVLIPSWWGERESNFALKLRVSASGEPDRVTSSLGLDAIVNFDWQVALGDESLNRDDFLRLVELKQPLVQVRGRWVELERQKVEEVLTVMRAQPTQAEMPLREVMQLGLGRKWESGLAVTSLEAEGWIQALLESPHRLGAYGIARNAREFSRSTETVSSDGAFLARVSGRLGTRSLPGGRHGAGKNHPGFSFAPSPTGRRSFGSAVSPHLPHFRC